MSRPGSGCRRRLVAAALVVGLAVAAGGCTGDDRPHPSAPRPTLGRPVSDWAYQLQGYPGGRLDALARAPQQLVVIDLARDAHGDYFGREEIEALRSSGKVVLAYFEIGSIEQFRPEYPAVRQQGDLILNRWSDWPDEFFVRYWDQRWWDLAVRPRIDQAVRAGFDGIYLDTPLAYEELELSLTPGRTRADLARAMVDLIVRISRYARSQRPGLLVFPQNSPELREYDGYTEAIDGIGMEDLFYRSPDRQCTESYCEENLGNARALRDAGKVVLAVDYASRAENVRAACARYRQEEFGGYVGPRELDRISPPCR
ncbi:endo alpha-1,4 polygalactosaminidase [Micromonospora sp. CPCC 205711]|uniref:endo alpha-1,4 polygalactosaminidase n=1 Tax=Micromonospora sp. CPCC 205547 TaxID=3122400 RepID=UPI002FF28EDE